jgi:hypothetical protein
MLMRNNTVVPMVIDVDVIKADVIVMVTVVVMVVAPSPSVRPPPGLSPASEP